jgi:plasmid stabilization system protein ParE
MAGKVVWSREATTDLDALAEYIAKDSAFYAAAFTQEILDAGRSLKEFSERGRIVPELGNRNIRELIVREYRLIDSIEKSRVIILGLVHGKKDLKDYVRKMNK